MNDDTIRETHKLMMSSPEVVERITYNLWRESRRAPNTPVERAIYDDLPEERKRELRIAAWEQCEAHWAMSEDEQQTAARAAFVRLADENAARCGIPSPVAFDEILAALPSDGDAVSETPKQSDVQPFDQREINAIAFTKGGENVFADLGLPDADARLARAEQMREAASDSAPLCDWCDVCRGLYPMQGESSDCQAVQEPEPCPNPHCDGGVIRGTVIGCAICMRPRPLPSSPPRNDASRADPALAVDPSRSTPDAVDTAALLAQARQGREDAERLREALQAAGRALSRPFGNDEATREQWLEFQVSKRDAAKAIIAAALATPSPSPEGASE